MISILMPIYNGIEFLSDSLNSIKLQSFTDWELIIGINGHERNSQTFKEARKYINPKIKVLDLYTLKSKSQALNQMINFCSYNWIALLDVDDIWNKVKLEFQVKYINNYDIIGTNCIWFGDRPGICPNIPLGDISAFDFTTLNPIVNSSVLIKKELCFWNESHVEDYDLWLRLKKRNKAFYNCKEILVMHRIHSQSFYNSNHNHKSGLELAKRFKN